MDTKDTLFFFPHKSKVMDTTFRFPPNLQWPSRFKVVGPLFNELRAIEHFRPLANLRATMSGDPLVDTRRLQDLSRQNERLLIELLERAHVWYQSGTRSNGEEERRHPSSSARALPPAPSLTAVLWQLAAVRYEMGYVDLFRAAAMLGPRVPDGRDRLAVPARATQMASMISSVFMAASEVSCTKSGERRWSKSRLRRTSLLALKTACHCAMRRERERGELLTRLGVTRKVKKKTTVVFRRYPWVVRFLSFFFAVSGPVSGPVSRPVSHKQKHICDIGIKNDITKSSASARSAEPMAKIEF